MNTKIENINIDYYDRLYYKSNPIFALLHGMVSYDQQSKSKRNYYFIKRIKSNFPKNSDELKYLDYGFGHGTLILKINFAIKIYATDISINAVNNLKNVAKLLGEKINVLSLNDFNNQKSDIKYDIISCSHVLEHVRDDCKLLKEFRLMLSDKGKLLLNVPINEIWEDPKHLHRYTKDSFLEMLFQSGFKAEMIIESDKLTSCFLKLEKIKKISTTLLLVLRLFKLIIAILPLNLILKIDEILADRYQYQQLIVIAVKND